MSESVFIICSTFLLVLVVYWIMPVKKMKEVNKALIALAQIFPISKVIDAIRRRGQT